MSATLARLVQQQSRDDAGRDNRPPRLILASDLGPSAWARATVDPNPDPEPWLWLDQAAGWPHVWVGLNPTWGAEVVGYNPRRGQVCPACHDATLRPHEVCLVCSATQAAPRRLPMMDRAKRAEILRGPAPLAARVKAVVVVARTRREKRAAKRTYPTEALDAFETYVGQLRTRAAVAREAG